MADRSQVDRAAMRVAAGKVETAAETIKGVQDRLHGHKAELMSGWGGNAATKFSGVFTAWDSDFTKVITALEGIHQKLTGTAIHYASTEEEQEQAVSKIEALLHGET